MIKMNRRIVELTSGLAALVMIAALAGCGGAQVAGITSATGEPPVPPGSTAVGSTTAASTVAADPVLTYVSIMMQQTLVPESFDFAVVPRDQNDNVIEVDGILSIKLWAVENGNFANPGQQIQEWDNVKLDPQEYIEGVGIMVSLPYVDYRPAAGTSAFVEVQLSTGGRNVASEVKVFQIRHPLGC